MTKEKKTESIVEKSKPTTFDQLPDEKSRVEEYLSFLCGKILDLDLLPEPKSRVELFLNYLCHNGGIGGGANPNPNGIEDVLFDATTNALNKVQNGITIPVIDHVVTEWKDLEDVHEIAYQNIFDPCAHVTKGSYYANNSGAITTSKDWARTVIPFTQGNTYTVYKRVHDSQTFVYLNADGDVVQHFPVNGASGGKFTGRYKVDTANAPAGAVAFGFNIYIKEGANSALDINNDVMVLDGDVSASFNALIPHTNGANIVIDGSKVSIGFDSTGTNIMANTVNDAIKCIYKNVIASLDTKVDRIEVGNTGDLIPQLQNGKLVDSIIPEIAITRVVDVQGQQQALEQVNNGTIQVGDSVRLTGDGNKVYQYTGKTAGAFADRFVEVSLGSETVKTINNIKPDTNGAFNLTPNDTDLAIELLVNGIKAVAFDYATQREIDELKDLLSF